MSVMTNDVEHLFMCLFPIHLSSMVKCLYKFLLLKNCIIPFILLNLESFFLILFIYFIYLWLCWVFVSVRGLSLVAASGGTPTLHRGARASHYRGLSRCRAQAPDAQAQ